MCLLEGEGSCRDHGTHLGVGLQSFRRACIAGLGACSLWEGTVHLGCRAPPWQGTLLARADSSLVTRWGMLSLHLRGSGCFPLQRNIMHGKGVSFSGGAVFMGRRAYFVSSGRVMRGHAACVSPRGQHSWEAG